MLIPPRVLNAARVAYPPDSGRAYLSGLHVVRNGTCRVEATDGKVLISTSWTPDDETEFPLPAGMPNPIPDEKLDFILPSKAAIDATKLAPKKPAKAILGNVKVTKPFHSVEIRATDLESVTARQHDPIEGTFPNTETAFNPPTKKPLATVKVDVQRLRDLCDAILKIHPESSRRVGRSSDPLPTFARLDIYSPERPIELLVADSLVPGKNLGNEVISKALLMPVVTA